MKAKADIDETLLWSLVVACFVVSIGCFAALVIVGLQ